MTRVGIVVTRATHRESSMQPCRTDDGAFVGLSATFPTVCGRTQIAPATRGRDHTWRRRLTLTAGGWRRERSGSNETKPARGNTAYGVTASAAWSTWCFASCTRSSRWLQSSSVVGRKRRQQEVGVGRGRFRVWHGQRHGVRLWEGAYPVQRPRHRDLGADRATRQHRASRPSHVTRGAGADPRSGPCRIL